MTAKDHVIAAGSKELSDMRDTKAVVAVGEIGHDDPDVSRLLAPKRARNMVRLVPKALGGRRDRRTATLADALIAIEGSRDRRGGAAHVMCDIAERNHEFTVAADLILVQSIAWIWPCPSG